MTFMEEGSFPTANWVGTSALASSYHVNGCALPTSLACAQDLSSHSFPKTYHMNAPRGLIRPGETMTANGNPINRRERTMRSLRPGRITQSWFHDCIRSEQAAPEGKASGDVLDDDSSSWAVGKPGRRFFWVGLGEYFMDESGPWCKLAHTHSQREERVQEMSGQAYPTRNDVFAQGPPIKNRDGRGFHTQECCHSSQTVSHERFSHVLGSGIGGCILEPYLAC